MLTVICTGLNKYSKAIKSICSHVGIIEFEILDPLYHDINRSFDIVLLLDKKIKVNCSKLFYCDPPDSSLNIELKKKQVEVYKEVKKYIDMVRDKVDFKKSDIPECKDLERYLNSLNGKVVEMKLKDRRRIGIYPDNQKLECIYDVEYHASTIVNIVKLFETFNASEILIKDV